VTSPFGYIFDFVFLNIGFTDHSVFGEELKLSLISSVFILSRKL